MHEKRRRRYSTLRYALRAMQMDTSEDLTLMGLLVGAACGAVLGVIGIIVAFVYFSRKQQQAAPVESAPCPSCRATSAKEVKYTWWGGLLGPKLLHHVECATCGVAYNGRTGKSNNVGIAIYMMVTCAVILGALGMLFLVLAM